MGSLTRDYEASIELVISEHQQLREIDSMNGLLKYVNIDADGFGFKWNEDFWKECRKRFAPEPNAKMINLRCNYYLALREERNRILDYRR